MKMTIHMLRSRLAPLYGARETEAMIRLIFEHLKGWRPVDIVLHADDELSPFMRDKVAAILHRLEAHEPLQYILGEARFYGLRMKVSPAVLIPRPETEQLVDMVVSYLGRTPDARVLDACTGSGCIAIALARTLIFPRVSAFDISAAALSIARDNVVANRTKVELYKADALTLKPDSIPGYPWDVIVANPPYIGNCEARQMEPNVLNYEPHAALFVPDANPLLFYEALARYGLLSLKPGRRIFFEINPLHADSLGSLMQSLGYENVEVQLDIHGHRRFLTADKPVLP